MNFKRMPMAVEGSPAFFSDLFWKKRRRPLSVYSFEKLFFGSESDNHSLYEPRGI
jgi:hypothetical protein